MKTLYVSDLDGTLLGSDARLSAETLRLLNPLLDAGLPFTCATARSYPSAAGALAGLRLRLPLAAYNGACFVDPKDDRPMETRTMNSADLLPLLDAMEEHEACPMVFAFLGQSERRAWLPGAATPALLQYIAERDDDPLFAPVESYNRLFEGDIIQISLLDDEAGVRRFRPILEEIPSITWYIQQNAYHPQQYWLEVTRHDADKAHALQRLKELTGAGEVVCFGDNNNDIPMFLAADRGYAVANACDALKAVATEVIGASDENGVARWLAENAELP